MKIIALSDIHGHTVHIKEFADVLIIAGDFSPLYCQQDPIGTIDWINRTLFAWFKTLRVDKFIIVPGNHDFACKYSFFMDDLDTIIHRSGLKNRVIYLNRDSCTIDGIKFYGIPDTEGLTGWAFSKPFNVDYTFDSDTDVLITHQPPRVGDVGFVPSLNREFGSIDLLDTILKSNIRLHICGHIHTGDHNKNQIRLHNGRVADVYNVSILDEDYSVAYEPTIINL